MDDEGPPPRPGALLEERYKREGLDLQFVTDAFLEAAELGDAASLRQRLAGLKAEERRDFLRSVDQQGRSGLQLAASRGDAEVVQALLDADANPNAADSAGTTALHSAAGRGAAASVELLLRYGAEPGGKDDQGETPLMWARGARVTDLLLEARADAGARDCRGRTALMCAAERGDVDGVQALARTPGAGLSAQDSGGVSAHAAAAAAGHAAVAELLASLGAAVGTADGPPAARVVLREEALHEAARRGDRDACSALLAESPLAVDAEVGGETALLLAAGKGAGGAVEVLLQARADPNHADAFLRESPLQRAVLAGGGCELLWLLLEARADPTQADLTGRRPCDIADAWGQSRAAEMLRAAAAGHLDLGGMD